MSDETMSDTSAMSLESQLLQLERITVNLPTLISKIIPAAKQTAQEIKSNTEFKNWLQAVVWESGYNGETDIQSKEFQLQFKKYMANLVTKERSSTEEISRNRKRSAELRSELSKCQEKLQKMQRKSRQLSTMLLNLDEDEDTPSTPDSTMQKVFGIDNEQQGPLPKKIEPSNIFSLMPKHKSPPTPPSHPHDIGVPQRKQDMLLAIAEDNQHQPAMSELTLKIAQEELNGENVTVNNIRNPNVSRPQSLLRIASIPETISLNVPRTDPRVHSEEDNHVLKFPASNITPPTVSSRNTPAPITSTTTTQANKPSSSETTIATVSLTPVTKKPNITTPIAQAVNTPAAPTIPGGSINSTAASQFDTPSPNLQISADLKFKRTSSPAPGSSVQNNPFTNPNVAETNEQDPARFKCDIADCNAEFEHLSRLKKHLRSAHKVQNPFPGLSHGCRWCGGKFKSQKEVSAHQTNCEKKRSFHPLKRLCPIRDMFQYRIPKAEPSTHAFSELPDEVSKISVPLKQETLPASGLKTEVHSEAEISEDEDVQVLFQCRKCGERVTSSERDAHRQMHKMEKLQRKR